MKRFRKTIAGMLGMALVLSSFSSCQFRPRPELTNLLHQIADTGPVYSTPVQTAPVEATAADDNSKDTWTVLLYLCGSDLETEAAAASMNLAEILDTGWSEQVNFIIETGGSTRWHTRGVSSTKLQRFKVGARGLEKLEEYGAASMGMAETLEDFLSWGAEKYPADKYMTLLWNHGGGSVGGSCYDEKFFGDSLTLAEMEEGIRQAGVHFELIGFDCCLMASLETGTLLAPHGKTMVASEEWEPGAGWDYTTWVDYLNTNPGCTGEELGRIICDSYMEKCKTGGMAETATMSVIDLPAMPAVNSAFKNMAAEMMNQTTDVDSLRALVSGARSAESYGGNSYYEGYSNMVDLGDLVERTKEVLPITTQAVEETLKRAVLYHVEGEYRSRANGLSVFYPLGDAEYYADEYCTATDNISYLRFIDTITDTWDAPDWIYEGTTGPVEVELGDDFYQYDNYDFIDPFDPNSTVHSSDYEIRFTTEIDEDGIYTLRITSGRESLLAVDHDLFWVDESSGRYYFYGTDVDVDADWENGIIRDNFQGEWMTVGGELVTPVIIEEDADYAMYAVPVKVNGEETNLRIRYDIVGESYKIIDTYGGVDPETGMSARDSHPLEEGDEITFLFYGGEVETDEMGELAESTGLADMKTYEMGTITYHARTTRVEKGPLEDGAYLYSFEVHDIFGNVHYSDPALITIENGELYIDEI